MAGSRPRVSRLRIVTGPRTATRADGPPKRRAVSASGARFSWTACARQPLAGSSARSARDSADSRSVSAMASIAMDSTAMTISVQVGR